MCRGPCNATEGASSSASAAARSWDIDDDPYDKDPIIKAYWMPTDLALSHRRLSSDGKAILRYALSGDSPPGRDASKPSAGSI